MDRNSSSIHQFKSISEATKEACEYIDGLRKGEIKRLKTPWKKFNDANMGGIEYNNIYTIAGMSGSGKTALINQLETGIIDLNPEEDIAILSFNFEMLASRLVGRKLSNKLKMTTSELYSGTERKISDLDYKHILEEAEKLSKYNITYVELPGTVPEISRLIDEFIQDQLRKSPTRGVIVFIDHVLLVNGRDGELERQTLFDLMLMLNEKKKKYKIASILLSQLNRNVEDKERILNSDLHYPQKSDLFGGDSMYQFSDVVLVSHRPEMLGIKKYGPQQLDTKGLIFHHYIKMREGEPFIAKMFNNLKHNEVLDENPSIAKKW